MKKLTSIQKGGIIAACAALLLLIGGILTFVFTRPFTANEKAADSPTAASASTAPAETAAAQSDAPHTSATEASAHTEPTAQTKPSEQATTAATAPTKPALPQALENSLSRGGFSAAALDELGASQLVVVSSAGSYAECSFFERVGNGWEVDEALSCGAIIGENGATDNMAEGSASTPRGLFSVGSAFYQYDMPETGLPAFHITYDTYWVDDPDSPNYNQRVVGEDALGGDHAEYMSENPYYKYGFVINYNTPPTGYARGSAIFFHIEHTTPTLGCVTVSEDMVLAYLARLDASKNPYILII